MFKRKYYVLKKIGSDEYYAGNFETHCEYGKTWIDTKRVRNWDETFILKHAYPFMTKREAKLIRNQFNNKFVILKIKNLRET